MAKVDLEKFSKEELQKIVAECSDKTELATRLGFTFANGEVHKKVVELVRLHDISISHFDKSKKTKARRKYATIKKNCPVCSEGFETQQGHPKEKITCSYTCSNKYFADSKHTDESNRKRSDTLIKHYNVNTQLPRIRIGNKTYVEFVKECPICKSSFTTSKNTQICCSNKCATTLRNQDPQYIEKLRAAAQQRIANGTHNGWSTRNKLKPSFPEKVVIGILEELGFVLERELKVGKWFIDFADVKRKIAIEIDGGQHKLPERKASDANKDIYLISQGWQVHRIPWKKLTKESREELKQKLIMILNQGVV
jgi:very-short-patch-repair endonuclease